MVDAWFVTRPNPAEKKCTCISENKRRCLVPDHNAAGLVATCHGTAVFAAQQRGVNDSYNYGLGGVTAGFAMGIFSISI
jgi:hypothetical protein